MERGWAAAAFDGRELLARVGDDGAFLAELADRLAGDGPTSVATMRRAVAAEDTERSNAAAHALNGMAGSPTAGPRHRLATEVA